MISNRCFCKAQLALAAAKAFTLLGQDDSFGDWLLQEIIKTGNLTVIGNLPFGVLMEPKYALPIHGQASVERMKRIVGFTTWIFVICYWRK
jgi:hypothetical protein